MKIGFCFMCKNDIHQLDMWLQFFENNYDKLNIYIHSYEKETITQEFVKKYQIDKHYPSKWGTLYPPIKGLLEVSRKNNDYKSILLSESTVPCKPFDYIYNLLTNDNYGYMSYVLRGDGLDNWDKNTIKMQEHRYLYNCNKIKGFRENIDYSHWFYNETWIIFSQEMIDLILNDKYYYQSFFKDAWAADENYPIYLLSLYGKLDLCKNMLTTYVDWNVKQTSEKFHPKLHDQVDNELCEKLLRTPNLLFARKFTKTSNISKIFKLCPLSRLKFDIYR